MTLPRIFFKRKANFHCMPSTPAELFNLRHAQLCNCNESIFGVVKKRFPILKTAPEYEYHHQVKLVLALTALHNFICRHAQGREDRFYREADLERERELAAGTQANSDLGGGRVEQGPIDDPMADYRDRIAQQMWQDYINYRRV
jgi:hypothetical protein